MVVLHQCDDTIGYSVPVLTIDDGDVYEGYATEDEAITAGFEHLAVIAGCTLDEYQRRVKAGE